MIIIKITGFCFNIVYISFNNVKKKLYVCLLCVFMYVNYLLEVQWKLEWKPNKLSMLANCFLKV